MPLPSEKEEVWRYTPIDELDLDAYAPAGGAAGERLDSLGEAFVAGLRRDIAGSAAMAVTHNGRLVEIERAGLADEVGVRAVADPPVEEPVLGRVLDGGDALVRLNDAFLPDAVVIDVPAGVSVSAPLVIVHWCDGDETVPAPASFPRTVVSVGRNAEVGVVEVLAGARGESRALVVPVTELEVDEAGHLSYVAMQLLGTGAWHVGRLAGRAGRDAILRTFSVGLGAAYDRTRADAAVDAPGAQSELRSAYLGTGSQVHDIRTLQDHEAPRTRSDLLCKGAVADVSRSVYSGLIRVHKGAVRTEAMQTNHNLVLDERAHADSVPNLDIEENDVRCSHASTVGPVDEDQLYYLESRGVRPERAEQLIVLGFFDDIVQRSPVPAVVNRLRQEVGIRLAQALDVSSPVGTEVADG